MTKLRVAVIGAGMGGLATAAALRRVGIEVTVYEQARRFGRIGAEHGGAGRPFGIVGRSLVLLCGVVAADGRRGR